MSATYQEQMARGNPDLALRTVLESLKSLNQLIDKIKPWNLHQTAMAESSRSSDFKVAELYVFIGTDANGEGIPRVPGPDGQTHLLVESNPALVEWFARRCPPETRQQLGIRIFKFTRGEEVTDQFFK